MAMSNGRERVSLVGNPWFVLATVMLGTLLIGLDRTVVNLAVPKIIGDFGISVGRGGPSPHCGICGGGADGCAVNNRRRNSAIIKLTICSGDICCCGAACAGPSSREAE